MLISSTSSSDDEEIDMELKSNTPSENAYDRESDKTSNASFIVSSIKGDNYSVESYHVNYVDISNDDDNPAPRYLEAEVIVDTYYDVDIKLVIYWTRVSPIVY